MGFSTLIDIIGSAVVGGMLFLILMRMNDAAIKNTFVNSGDLLVQQNLVEVVKLLEYDFRKIAYCQDWKKIPNPSSAILRAGRHRIDFLTDVDRDGNVDTMHYYLGTTEELQETVNPRDKLLYRVINNNRPIGVNLGITQFDLLYFDVLGDTLSFPIKSPDEIYTMQVNITVENIAAYDRQYSNAFWRQVRLAARNLRNR